MEKQVKIEGQDFFITKGKFGAQNLLWTSKINRTNQKKRLLDRTVVDIVEIPQLLNEGGRKNDFFSLQCASINSNKELPSTVGIVRWDSTSFPDDARFTEVLPEKLILTWRIDSKGRIAPTSSDGIRCIFDRVFD